VSAIYGTVRNAIVSNYEILSHGVEINNTLLRVEAENGDRLEVGQSIGLIIRRAFVLPQEEDDIVQNRHFVQSPAGPAPAQHH
jgi:hypothetical protein